MRATRFLASAAVALPLTLGAAGMASADTADRPAGTGDVAQHQQVQPDQGQGEHGSDDEHNEGLLGGLVHGLIGGSDDEHGHQHGNDQGNRDRGDQGDRGYQNDSDQGDTGSGAHSGDQAGSDAPYHTEGVLR